MTTETFNGWIFTSKDLKFYLLSNAERVSVKMADDENGELFYGTVTAESIRIHELNTYQANIEINSVAKTITFIKILSEY